MGDDYLWLLTERHTVRESTQPMTMFVRVSGLILIAVGCLGLMVSREIEIYGSMTP